MHQSIISILTGCLCVCTVTISTSTSSTTATSSTPWTSASSSLETLSGSELPTSTTQSVIGSITTTNTSPSTSTADPTSKVETTSDVLTPTIIHTPTTTQLSTGTAEMTTVKETTNTETSVNSTTHLETTTSLTSDTEAAVSPTIISESTTTETPVTPTINLETTTRLTTNTDTSATHTIHSETTMPDTETVPTAYTGTTESHTTYSDTTNQTTTYTESTTISTIYSTNNQTTASPPTANTNTTATLTINSETTTGPTTEAIMYNMTILHTTTVPTVITGTTDIHTTNTDTTTETTTYTETTVTLTINSETTTEAIMYNMTIPHTTAVPTVITGTTEILTTNTDTTTETTTYSDTSTLFTTNTTFIKTTTSPNINTETTVSSTSHLETTTSLTTNTDTNATHAIISEATANYTTNTETSTMTITYPITTMDPTEYNETTENNTTITDSTNGTTTYSETTTTTYAETETTTSSTIYTEAITTEDRPTSAQPVTTPTTSVSPSVTSTSIGPLSTTSKLECLNTIELVNGNVTISADGKLANYTCHDGYRLNGSAIRTCANGTWSGYNPSCLKNCNINLTLANGNVHFLASNTIATFTCLPGFFLNGSTNMTCGDGNWSAEVPTCQRKDCNINLTLANGNIHFSASNTIATFTCLPGFFLNGSTNMTCDDGNLSAEVPTCQRKDCGNLTAPGNGSLIQNGSLYESVVNYTCDNGYYIVGTRTRTCLDSGRWSGQTPSCARVAVPTCTCKNETDIWGFAWYESMCGQTQWSQCPKGSSGNYTRQCDSKGVWVNLNNTCVREAISNISNTLNALNSTNVNASTIVNVLHTMTAATTVNTTTSEKLTGGEVSKLADSLSKVADILKSSTGTVNITTSMTKDFLTSTSNLLEEKDTWKTMKDSGTNDGGKILKAVDTLTDVLRNSFQADSTINKTFSTTNIAIELFNMTGNKAIKFPGGEFADTLAWGVETTKTAITFQPSSFNASFATGVLYRNMSDILPTHSSNDSIYTYTEIRGQVVAFSVSDTSVNLTKNITIQIEHFSPSFTNPQCSFWNEQSSGDGQWSTSGCFFVNSTANLTTCECNHLTNFAVLMSPFVEADNDLPLRLVSIIGISVSIFGLLLTVLLHACLWRQVKNNRSSLLINLCVALLCAYIVFLSGVDRTESKAFCAAVAALLHYIYLVVFCLMLVEGIEIVITVVYVFATKSRARQLIILAWAIPAVIVGISLGVTKTKGYGNEKFCWLSIKDGVIWAFVGPTLLIILLNVGSLVIVLRKLFTMKAMENKNFKDKILTSVRSLCVLVPLMGVSWILGIFYVNADLAVMQYVFAVCNGLQGFCIFLIHCVFNPKMRVALCIRYRRYKSEADTKDSRHKRAKATSNSTSDWRNLILETSSYETIKASTEIGKIKRPNVDYKPSSSEDHDDNAVGYTSLGMSNAGYTAYTGYNRHAKHFSDKRKVGYLDYRNYTSTEL